MANGQVLTERTLQGLKPTGKRYEIVDDSFSPGTFSVRVSADGRRSFYLRYRPRGSRQLRRVRLGQHPVVSLADAREAARGIMAQVTLGDDPEKDRKETRESAQLTFGTLFRLYMNWARRNKKSWRYDEDMMNRDVLPAWRKRPVAEIVRADVIAVLQKIEARGSLINANRTASCIHRIFNWGIDEGVISANPALRLRRRNKERPRDRWISDPDELRRLWAAFEAESPIVEGVFKLRLLTGQRGIEIRSIRWQDIQGQMWTIPAEVSKNGKAHRVPLSRQAVACIEAMRPLTGDGGYVFPADRGASGHVNTLNKAFERIKAASGVDFRPHDLRRTMASHMAEMGISLDVIGAVLGHAPRGVTAVVYALATHDKAKAMALQKWADHLDDILAGRNPNIITWPGATGEEVR